MRRKGTCLGFAGLSSGTGHPPHPLEMEGRGGKTEGEKGGTERGRRVVFQVGGRGGTMPQANLHLAWC